MTESSIDLSGLKCPLPALKTRKALTRLATLYDIPLALNRATAELVIEKLGR